MLEVYRNIQVYLAETVKSFFNWQYCRIEPIRTNSDY